MIRGHLVGVDRERACDVSKPIGESGIDVDAVVIMQYRVDQGPFQDRVLKAD
jgi:hypothetical protein